MNLVSYNTALNYSLIEELNFDITKVLKDHIDQEILAQEASSIAISAAITAYARIIMNKHKIAALSKGLSIYYSDKYSLVLDGKLSSELVHPTELGKFKLEYEVKEGIFITGKTHCLVLKDGTLVKRAKGVDPNTLSYEDYLSLLKGTDVNASKKSSIKDYTQGSVNITCLDILLKADAYSRRVKLYDDNNIWVNTKPLYIDNLWLNTIPGYISTELSLIIYTKPCLYLIVINNIKPDLHSASINNTYRLFKNIMVYPLLPFFIALYILGKGLL